MQTPAPDSRRVSARHRVLALALPVLLVVATACSGGEDPDDSDSSPTASSTVTGAPPATSTAPADDAGTTSVGPPDDAGTTSAPPPDDSETTSNPPPTETAAPTEPTGPAHAFGAYGIAAGHPEAVQVGIDILERGGNAVDAAVATAFAMGVIEPLTSGVGGGGTALVVPMPDSTAPGNPDKALAYDYRETLQSSGKLPKSRTGIPGFVAGMAELHAEHGQLPWRDVLQPAIDLAEFGVPASWWLAQELRTERGRAVTADLPQFRNQALEPLEENDLLIQLDLAETLETIARDGRDGFYTGYLAQELTRADGIDAKGLDTYAVDVRDPVRGAIRGHVVMAAAPATAGVALVQLLQVAEANGLDHTKPGTSAYIDTLSDAWLVADESMDTVVGDPNFVDVPIKKLTDPTANAALEVAAPAPSGEVAAGRPADGNTTHLSVVDADGLSVSMTNTVTDFWGSGQEIGGFFVNNHLIRFGTTGRTKANDPEPGKRPVSFMAPAIVLDSELRPALIVGSPGGRRIPNIQANVISRWLDGQPLQDAVDSPRFHLDEGTLYAEKLPQSTTRGLEKLDYRIRVAPAAWNLFGSAQALELDHAGGTVIGATDKRRTGAWDSGPGLRP
ncbi:gamma-glutamyltransferase [Ornithinimicrobium faecis]|uniref:Gamma-glutamyltransferase n=1 Tax=Ornithinimicrobium faecis TaxID=2934158 RepID=A0ABY4YQW1_9MICO|nr:gamma-glutamyltransferase [Ornithinimicrobium sp. HY1793]USQ79103.1 gamma-glutamyltransferase [Ornithinimicrobium sp. HY1793]